VQTGATRKGFAGVTPGVDDCSRDRPREIFVREFRLKLTAYFNYLPFAAMFGMAWTDFSTSFVKKNFPSLGTIMI
jgi:hypothetical protein